MIQNYKSNPSRATIVCFQLAARYQIAYCAALATVFHASRPLSCRARESLHIVINDRLVINTDTLPRLLTAFGIQSAIPDFSRTRARNHKERQLHVPFFPIWENYHYNGRQSKRFF